MLHISYNALCLGLDQPSVQCRKVFLEVTVPCRFPTALLLPDGRLQKFRVTGLHFIPHELPEIFIRTAVEMLFRANLSHPTFVDQTVGTHGQGGIPDMLQSGVQGMLYGAAGDDAALSAAILQVLALPDHGTALGTAAQIRARVTHDAAKNTAQMIEIYRKVLQREGTL